MTATTVERVAGPDLLIAAPALAAGEYFELDLNGGPKYGCGRQGGCYEINTINDPVLGPAVEMVTLATDQTLQPGTNSPPLGGCYAVHRKLGGVSSNLIAPHSLPLATKSYVRVKVAIPSAQPGLPGGFPKSMAGAWLSLHESYGPPFIGSPVTALAVADDPKTGALAFVYGPSHQQHSFWTPFRLDEWFDFIIGLTPSTDPAVGGASVTCNGVPLRSSAGNVWEPFSTIIASDINAGALLCYEQNYRSMTLGAELRVLFGDWRIGSTLASVSGGSTGPPPPPVVDPPTVPPVIPPVTPPPPPVAGGVTLTLTAAEATALSRYISGHGIPAGSMGPLIRAIVSQL